VFFKYDSTHEAFLSVRARLGNQFFRKDRALSIGGRQVVASLLPSSKQVDTVRATGNAPQAPQTVWIISHARTGQPRSTLFEGTIMKISARNQLKGKILEVKKGATTSHVRVEIGPGQIVTSSITNEAVDELGLKAGGAATVVIKASDVMIAID
jgi:molybdopterin-binding protein